MAQCVQRAVHLHCSVPNVFLLRCTIRGGMASEAYTVTDAHAKVNERQFLAALTAIVLHDYGLHTQQLML